MVNLFHAGMGRLWKDKILWACTGAYFIFSAYYMWNTHRDLITLGESWPLDKLFFASLPYYAVACAVFVSLFVGTEYADGTLRNKIIVGHARWEVYLSTYLVCLAGDLVILAGWFAGEATGILYFGFWQAGAPQMLQAAVCLVLMAAALTGLLVLLSLSFTNRAVTAVEAVLLAVALLMTASLLYNRLSEPEINSASVVVYENGQMEQLPPAPNPRYLDGWQREAAQWFLDIFPTGQTLYLAADGSLPHPARSAAASAALMTVSGLAGAAVFVKKDLR